MCRTPPRIKDNIKTFPKKIFFFFCIELWPRTFVISSCVAIYSPILTYDIPLFLVWQELHFWLWSFLTLTSNSSSDLCIPVFYPPKPIFLLSVKKLLQFDETFAFTVCVFINKQKSLRRLKKSKCYNVTIWLDGVKFSHFDFCKPL